MDNYTISPADKAAVILFQMAHLPIQERLDALAEKLAEIQGPGHTRHTVIEAYKECASELDWICRDICLKIVEAQT